MEALQTLEVRRVPSSSDLMQAGDYCLIQKREPIVTTERARVLRVEAPKGIIRRLAWTLLGPKYQVKESVETLWPDYDAIILMCPHCNQPIGTTKDHRIVNIEPLTIEKPLACAYSRQSPTAPPTIAFQIKDGKIMPA
jgi:hypothetical protein